MEKQIILDDKSFKALSADSRVSILKSLGERRRTLSELSQKLSLGNSTIKEHCDILINAELIKLVDEGRKWKYYELTGKGKQIVTPNIMEEVKVLIVLCFGIVMLGAVTFFMLQTFSETSKTSLQSAPNYYDDSPTLLTKNTTEASTTTQKDQITGASTANPIDGNYNSNEEANIRPAPELLPVSCPPKIQCQLCPTNTITPEFFVMSALLTLVFGIILGWTIKRRY